MVQSLGLAPPELCFHFVCFWSMVPLSMSILGGQQGSSVIHHTNDNIRDSKVIVGSPESRLPELDYLDYIIPLRHVQWARIRTSSDQRRDDPSRTPPQRRGHKPIFFSSKPNSPIDSERGSPNTNEAFPTTTTTHDNTTGTNNSKQKHTKMSEPDELYTLRAQFWMGHYMMAMEEAKQIQRRPMSPALKAEREEIVQRCLIALGQWDRVIAGDTPGKYRSRL